MSDPTKELVFQNEVIAQMVAAGWKRGAAGKYGRALDEVKRLFPQA